MESNVTNQLLNNLSIIGRFLEQISNENGEQTEYFVAKTSIDNIKALMTTISTLVDTNTLDGLNRLVSYLEKKVEKRNRQANGEFFQG